MRHETADFKAQLETMRTHPGFIAALDQSGGSTPGALRAYGIKEDAWSNEDADARSRASDADAHHDQPRASRARGSSAPSCSRTPSTGTSKASPPRTICGTSSVSCRS